MTKDFAELLALFRRHGARAVIVGAHAVAHHSKPRYTKDYDLLVEPSATNAARILGALSDFGFGEAGITEEDLTTPGMVIQLGYAPNRVDLLTSLAGVTFDEVWRGREEGSFAGVPFDVIGKRELIRAKRGAGRAQDLADLEWLEGDPGDETG